jgi:hypothetical protein
MWVGGVSLRPEYRAEILNKVISEINWALADGAEDIALILSNHGTGTKNSWCYDSKNDHAHFTHKLLFVWNVENTLSDQTFTSNFGTVVSKVYEPYALTSAEIADLADQTDGDDIAILDQNIQLCKVELSTGRRLAFYRVSGQSGFTGDDPEGLTFSPREALNDIIDVQNPTAEWNITHVVDFLYQFMGQSNDLLWDHRYDGYGEELEECEDGGDPQACDEQMYLSELALIYSNPLIEDASNPLSWRNFQTIPEQYCYPTTGNPLNSSDPCWDFGHDNTSCPTPVPEGCYVSLFTVYDNDSDPKYDPINTPGGLKVKITNGSWGWDGKVNSSKNLIAEAIAFLSSDVEIGSFEALPRFRKVILRWIAENEDNTIGYNIYRSTAEDGEFTKINATMIAAKGESNSSSRYIYIDRGLENGVPYYYELEHLNNDGTSLMHGPVTATPRLLFWLTQ